MKRGLKFSDLKPMTEEQFAKTKNGQLHNLFYETLSLKNRLVSFDEKSYLCNALSIATKGTKLEDDAKRIITLICPTYFEG